MDNEDTLQRIAVAEYYTQPESRVVLKNALVQVHNAITFLALGPTSRVDEMTPDECHALSRALDLFIPTLPPIIRRLN